MSHKTYFQLAAEQAERATCKRAKCGSVIVADSEVIGAGFNAPPLGDESERYCDAEFDTTLKPKYDKTCCVHAEWNAIIDGLKNNAEKMAGATLYFMRIDDAGNFTDAVEPFCTVCSRLAMQSGLARFALWVDEVPKIYDVRDYNRETYEKYITVENVYE